MVIVWERKRTLTGLEPNPIAFRLLLNQMKRPMLMGVPLKLFPIDTALVTVTVKEQWTVPAAPVALQWTAVMPTGKADGAGGEQMIVEMGLQFSLAVTV